jgi:hypothetical protein
LSADFCTLLHFYDNEYIHLNLNGIFHTPVFIHFCEAFMGIKPHWVLFRKFFWLKSSPAQMTHE